jgi:hypothetical protein
VQQLRKNPFDAQFVQLLGRVLGMVATPATSTTADSAAQHLLSLDLVGALQGRLVCLDPHSLSSQRASSGAEGSSQSSQGASSGAEGSSQSSQGASSGADGSSQSSQGGSSGAEGSSQSSQGASSAAEGSSQSSQGASSGADGSSQSSQGASSGAEGSSQSSQGASSAAEGSSQSSQGASSGAAGSSQGSQAGCSAADNALDTFCAIMEGIMAVFSELVGRVASDHRKLPGGAAKPVLVAMEKLLCSPAALWVAVQRGLSPEVQEAAKAGSMAAGYCMGAVRLLFRQAAFTLYLHAGLSDPDSDGGAQELRGRLAGFLQAEESLPFLEPLCLPPDYSSEPLTGGTLCPKATSCCNMDGDTELQ